MAKTVTNSEQIATSTTMPDQTNSEQFSGNSTTTSSANLSQDIAQKVADLPQLAPDWTYRRQLIFRASYFCGGVFGLVVLTVCGGLLLSYFHDSKGPVDTGLVGLAETIIYSLTFFAGSIIGTYCFGAAFEINSYRGHITNMVTAIATAGKSAKPENKPEQ